MQHVIGLSILMCSSIIQKAASSSAPAVDHNLPLLAHLAGVMTRPFPDYMEKPITLPMQAVLLGYLAFGGAEEGHD